MSVCDEFVCYSCISWADEECDTSAWLGNILQKEAFEKLYSVAERVRLCSDTRLKQDWNYLQASDHFYYMCTKHFADGAVHSHYSPYDSAYEAFTNYMNVLSDFIVRVEEQFPDSIENEELNALITTIRNQAAEIEVLKKELASAKANAGVVEEEKPAKKAPAKKKAAPKAEPKEEQKIYLVLLVINRSQQTDVSFLMRCLGMEYFFLIIY